MYNINMVAQLDIFGGSVEIVEEKKKQSHKKIVKVNHKLIRKYQILEYFYLKLFNMLNINILTQEEIIYKGLFVAFPDEQQAEVIGTQKMNINERIKFYTDFFKGER